MKTDAANCEYILGLDLGSASIGWALIGLDSSRQPQKLLKAGVRIFEPGVEGSTLEIEQGKDKSKAIARRTARLQRRQLRRRAARQRDLFRLLQSQGLLPESDPNISDASLQRHLILNDLDSALRVSAQGMANLKPGIGSAIEQLLPYYLRKAALDRKLEAYELGRVLYHLIQRRGFKSNRREGKSTKDKVEELGKVKLGISELARDIKTSDARTLGEYFASLDPHSQKVRRRWTARKMFEDEFELIWNTQQAYAPQSLTAELKKEIARLLFYQRPIASQEHLIGHCELEKEERRAPWASLDAQRFRLLQKVNDLMIVLPGQFVEVALTAEERQKTLDALQNAGDQKFTALRKLLALPRQSQFNLERGDEKTLRGNRTNTLMRTAFGEFWDEMTQDEKNAVVKVWVDTESEDRLVDLCLKRWALDEPSARLLAAKNPEDGYCGLSLKAIRKLLPIMETGMSFKTAEKEIYGERFSGGEPRDFLPIVREALPELRNPAVERALSEMRKLVNAIVREYGKPYEIRIEMARELRKSRKEREKTTKNNRDRERLREKAKARILAECGFQNPSRDDVQKALLFDECGGICPYTGRAIEFSSLFGDTQFDVEHIIPLSRYPDDSFLNKTLCYHEENRSVKRGRTPWEAYGTDEERWSAIELRVQKFSNPAKLRRFQLRSEEELGEFTARQMNDTRYTTRLAADLLAELYGGRDISRGDGTNRRVVFATSGQVTATLRRSWLLEGILREAIPSANGESKGKPRTDHRHHAVDAIVIGLTNEKTIKMMSTVAAQAVATRLGSRTFRSIQSPWPSFVDSIRPQVEQMIISHRPEHKMTGALHDETNYGRPYDQGKKTYVHIRKPLASLSAKDIEGIVDPMIRATVHSKADALGGDLSKCETANDWPTLTASDGRQIPIRKARIRKVMKVTQIAQGSRQRFVQPGNNHHVTVFAQLDVNGRERWDSVPVSLLKVSERKRRGERIVQRNYLDAEESVFKFSLMGGDTVELHKSCDHKNGVCSPALYRLRSIESDGHLFLVRITDARLIKDIAASGERWRPCADALRKLDCRKVVVDLLGRVHPASD